MPHSRALLIRARDIAAEALARGDLTAVERRNAGYMFSYAQAQLVGMTREEAQAWAKAEFPDFTA